MRTDLKTLTIENLKAAKACEEGMEWITPIIESAPDTVADRLCAEHPLWHQWAIENGFDVPVSPEVWDRMGCQIVDGALRHTQTAGDWSTQTAGDESTQTAGDGSTQTAGDGSTQTAGYRSTQTAGDGSTQTAGDGSTQTACYRSTQTAGYGSTQTAGDWSTQTAGAGSRHKAGLNSAFVCRYWEDGEWWVAVTVNPDPDYYWTFDIEKQEWVHAEDQSTLGGAA